MPARDTARLSSKFRISIPKAVRAAKDWQVGQVFAFLPKGVRRWDFYGLVAKNRIAHIAARLAWLQNRTKWRLPLSVNARGQTKSRGPAK